MFTELLEEEKIFEDTVNEIKQNTSKEKSNRFIPKKQISDIPYLPICFFIDSSFPEEVKNEYYHLIDKLLSRNYTIRINGDDKEFIEKIRSLNPDRVEVYIPWKNFNGIESKFYFNHEALKSITRANFIGWDKVPDTVKGILTRNVRMILGNSNNSVCLCVVLYTPDGATNKAEVTKETGKFSFVINVASKFGIPVINLKKPKMLEAFLKNFGI